ncbi:MAG TPA: SPOR domain-containing protein [bacterium]|nr:SPOR domain-containing protein [bacterium]
MRNNPVLVVLMFVGLFGLAVLLGYVAGQAFLSPPGPQVARPARPAPAPAPAPATPAQPPISLQPPEAGPSEPPQPPPAEPAQPAPAPTPSPTPVPVPAPLSPPVVTPPVSAVTYRVQVGAFLRRENAEARVAQLVKDGFDAYINQSSGLFKVQVGAFKERENAEKLADQLRALGYEVLITTTK